MTHGKNCNDSTNEVADSRESVASDGQFSYIFWNSDDNCSDGDGSADDAYDVTHSVAMDADSGTRDGLVALKQGDYAYVDMNAFFENMPQSLLREGCYDDYVCYYDAPKCYHAEVTDVSYRAKHYGNYESEDYDFSFDYGPKEGDDSIFDNIVGLTLDIASNVHPAVATTVDLLEFIADYSGVTVDKNISSTAQEHIYWDISLDNTDPCDNPDKPGRATGAEFRIQNSAPTYDDSGTNKIDNKPKVHTQSSFTFNYLTPDPDVCMCEVEYNENRAVLNVKTTYPTEANFRYRSIS